jgi:hypothetical protein
MMRIFKNIMYGLTFIHLLAYILLVAYYWGENNAITDKLSPYFSITIPGFGAVALWLLWFQGLQRTAKSDFNGLILAILFSIVFLTNCIAIFIF